MQTSKRTPAELSALPTQLARLRVGMLITVISISEWMAHTIKQQAKIKTLLPLPTFDEAYVDAQRGHYRLGTITPLGKRKEFHLQVDASTLIFEGHRIPIRTDAEVAGGSFSGNACLNLSAPTIAELREWIEHRNLNPFFTAKDCVLYVDPTKEFNHDDGIPVYPDEPTAHSVVDRIREKRAEELAAA